MKERVIRVQNFSPLRNCYEAIITDCDEYAMTEHRYIWRRCSDNVRGRIVTHQDGVEFTAEA